MSVSKLGERCQVLKCELEQIATMVNSNLASLQFSIDDRYEVEYLVDCLETNTRRLKSVLKSCMHWQDGQPCVPWGETSSSTNDFNLTAAKNDVHLKLCDEQLTSGTDGIACKQHGSSDIDLSTSDSTDICSPSASQDVCHIFSVKY